MGNLWSVITDSFTWAQLRGTLGYGGGQGVDNCQRMFEMPMSKGRVGHKIYLST